MDLSNFIGNAFSDILHEKGMLQIDIHIKTGLPTSQISKIFTGKSLPSHPTIFKICDALDVEPEIFFFKAVTERDITDNRLKRTIAEYEKMLDFDSPELIDNWKKNTN